MTSRRSLLQGAAALAARPLLRGAVPAMAAGALSSSAWAQAGDYPNKGVRMVVPYPAGGGTDIIARMISSRMADTWGQSFIVDNKAGASGIIGNDIVAKAPPDGYTLLVGITTLIQMPHLQSNLPYSVFDAFTPITQLAYSADLLLVPAANPANTLKEFLEQVRKEPGKASIGSYGSGTSSHIHAAMLNTQAKTDMVHTPFKGGAQVLTDLIGGQLTCAFVDLTSASSQISSGRFKALAITAERRFKKLPDVPTFTELGYKDFEPAGWFALLGPANMPAPVTQKLSVEVQRILKLPEVTQRIDDIGLIVGGNSPAEFAASMKRDYDVWGKVIKEANIRLDG